MRIVVVDDEPLIVMNLKEILESNGHEVVGTASNGYAAIDLCMKTNPDVLIADIRMPDLDGLTTVKCVYEKGYVGTIIIVSAFSDDELVEKAAEYGVSAFLVKPIETKTLLSTLRVAAGRSEERQALRREIQKANASIESRKRIERAKGMLMKKNGYTEQEAFDYLRRISKDNNLSMDLVAGIVLEQNE